MVQPDVRATVHEVLGTHGDETLLEYVISVVEDEDFDWGEDGEEAFEHVGPFLVRPAWPGMFGRQAA